MFVSENTILASAVFGAKRGEDHAAAARHEKRLLAQVPPIADYLEDPGF